jgi:hypothetical protein
LLFFVKETIGHGKKKGMGHALVRMLYSVWVLYRGVWTKQNMILGLESTVILLIVESYTTGRLKFPWSIVDSAQFIDINNCV